MTSGTKTRATAPPTAVTIALSYFVPATHHSAAASTPHRSSPAPRPAFSKPHTQPPSFSLSTRYSGKIESLVSYRKQSHLAFSNRYIHGGSLAAEFPSNLRSPLAFSTKINRHTGKIEHLVSYRKQRTAPQINRHISQGSCFPFSLFPLPFSNPDRIKNDASPTHKMVFSSHSPPATSHCLLFRNFFQPVGLTPSGWCAFAQPLKNKDLSVRNQLHWSRIQFCETATGHLDPSAVLPDLSCGGN
jgi:hypothetical protein